jgi:hypothetical protein
VLVPRSSGTPVATWAWTTWVVSRRRVLEAVFVLLESSSRLRRIFIGSHSLPPLWFAVSVLQKDVPKLTGRVAALNRFIPRAAERSLPFFQVLRSSKNFQWSET